MPQFLVDVGDLDPEAGTATLRGDEARHLLRVLRARGGDPVTLFDGVARRWQGKLAGGSGDEARIVGLEPLPANEPRLSVELVQGLPKGERWEWILEKGTELGAVRFRPVHTARTVARIPADRAPEKTARWHKILVAAAKQCERARVPQVLPPLELEELLRELGAAGPGELRVSLTERLPQGAPALPPGPVARVLMAAGPEGGWSPEDQGLLAAAGFRPWSLGPRILRAETASVAALSVLQARWGDLEAPEAPW